MEGGGGDRDIALTTDAERNGGAVFKGGITKQSKRGFLEFGACGAVTPVHGGSTRVRTRSYSLFNRLRQGITLSALTLLFDVYCNLVDHAIANNKLREFLRYA